LQTRSDTLKAGEWTLDTSLSVDGEEAKEWTFQETLIDCDHCSCVAVAKPRASPPAHFAEITDLLADLPLYAPCDDVNDGDIFAAMQTVKPFH